jgi:peptidoglycan/LPS O-acetylase OafA/YrhL
MFGTYRYLLAHMVVIAHLAFGVGMWTGAYAVFSFFALSGYLMTMVLDTTYPATAHGLWRYLANRALRIYPPYLLVLALAAAVVLWDDYWAAWIGNVRMPRDPVEWLRNLGIFSLHLDQKGTARLVPPSWSVDIELCFYVLMGLGLARRRSVVDIWLVVSILWTVWANVSGLPFPERYAALLPASLPYALGAALWMHRDSIRAWVHGPVQAVLAPALYLVHAALADMLWGSAFEIAFYVSLGLTAWAIAALTAFDASGWPASWRRIDAFLGNLSYPVFLCHFPVAAVLAITGVTLVKGPRLFWLSLPLISVVAWVIHRLSEQPLVLLRDRVRGRGAAALAE